MNRQKLSATILCTANIHGRGYTLPRKQKKSPREKDYLSNKHENPCMHTNYQHFHML